MKRRPTISFRGGSLQFVHDEVQPQGSQEAKLSGRMVRARWDETLDPLDWLQHVGISSWHELQATLWLIL